MMGGLLLQRQSKYGHDARSHVPIMFRGDNGNARLTRLANTPLPPFDAPITHKRRKKDEPSRAHEEKGEPFSRIRGEIALRLGGHDSSGVVVVIGIR